MRGGGPGPAERDLRTMQTWAADVIAPRDNSTAPPREYAEYQLKSVEGLSVEMSPLMQTPSPVFKAVCYTKGAIKRLRSAAGNHNARMLAVDRSLSLGKRLKRCEWFKSIE